MQEAIRQSRPFETPAVEAYVLLLRVADLKLSRVEEALRPTGLSPTQYNVLRILRGAGRDGLACREIAERMITRDPDITRLLDRLEKRRLIARSRSRQDRRVVRTRITPEGLQLLKGLDRPLVKLHEAELGRLGPRRLNQLIGLLEELLTDTWNRSESR
jgi:DNA-binding MarR family transcriptional regulator